MHNSVAVLCSLLAVVLLGSHASAQRPPGVQAGVSDRAGFEQWIAAQSGATRAGADYWIAHRSTPRDAHCNGRGDTLQGCLEAQRRLAPLDARRKADPDYRLGWNGAPPVTATDQSSPLVSGHNGAPVLPDAQAPHAQDLPGGLSASSHTSPLFDNATMLIASSLIVVIAVVAFKSLNTARRRKNSIQIAFAEIEAKSHLLHVRREQLTQPDFYGTRDFKKWDTEKSNFVQTRIVPLLDSQGMAKFAGKIKPTVLDRIETAACRPIERNGLAGVSNPAAYSPAMDPVHYEMYCASQLKQAGWTTKPTPATGDQGADIYAERKGMTLVVQCKLYSGSVGNAAVQEVIAGRVFYRADLAIVVSNARFTRSARDLAGISRVTLLHHAQLSTYGGEIGPRQLREAAD